MPRPGWSYDPRMEKVSWSTCLAGAALAGLALALIDLLAAPALAPGGAVATPSGRFLVVLLLPVAALPWALLWRLLGPRGGLLLPAAAAFFLGRFLALGRHARTLPLAAAWDWILGAAVLVPGWFLTRKGCRTQAGGLLPRAALAALGLVAALAACAVQRGRYDAVRQLTLLLAGMAFFPLCLSLALRWPRGVRRALVAVVLLGGIAGGFSALRERSTADWALDEACAVTPIVRSLRTLFLSADPTPTSARPLAPPVLGTPLAERSLRLLASRAPLPRGVLLITIDALRADVVGSVVGGAPVTPFLDDLGRRGLVFERAYTPGPGTHLALFGFLSGLYPSQFLRHPRSFDGVPLITSRLETAGIPTRAVYPRGCLTLGNETFRRFALDFGRASLQPGLSDLPVEETFRHLRPGPDDRRWFSYLHLMLPHHPYDQAAPAFVRGDGEFAMYCSEVRQADDVVRQLLSRFREAGLLERAWVVISADHGEEFGEHGSKRHGSQLFDESVHVPLLVVGPGVRTGRVPEPVSLVDLAPTLHHLFGLPDPAQRIYAGRSWIPLIAGLEDPARDEGILTENPPIGIAVWNTREAIVRGAFKLIRDVRTRRSFLYDLENDPAERRDLAAGRPRLVRDLTAALMSLRSSVSISGEDPFAHLESASEMLLRAEEQGPLAVLGHLRLMRGLPPDLVARALRYLGRRRLPGAAEELLQRFGSSTEPEIRLACRLLGATLSGTLETQRALLRSSARSAANQAGLYDLAAALRDPTLRDRALRDVEADDPSVAIGAAAYLQVLEGRAPEPGLIRRALNAPSPLVRSQAAELVEKTGEEAFLSELLEALERTREIRSRATLLRVIGRHGEARAREALLRAAWSGGEVERDTALTALALQEARDGGTHFTSPTHKAVLARSSGVEAVDERQVRMTETTARLPLAQPTPGGLLALFLSVPEDRSQRLLLALGSWRGTVEHPPTAFHPPLVFRLPADARAQEFSITLLEGRPEDVRIAGWILLPPLKER